MATTQKLELKGYMIMDFQINMPALSQCSQLSEVNFLKNFLFMDSMKKLLYHTANLRQLTRGNIPWPL